MQNGGTQSHSHYAVFPLCKVRKKQQSVPSLRKSMLFQAKTVLFLCNWDSPACDRPDLECKCCFSPATFRYSTCHNMGKTWHLSSFISISIPFKDITDFCSLLERKKKKRKKEGCHHSTTCVLFGKSPLCLWLKQHEHACALRQPACSRSTGSHGHGDVHVEMDRPHHHRHGETISSFLPSDFEQSYK